MSVEIKHPADYKPAVERVMEYLRAEMNSASPAVVIAWCEDADGETVAELALSDLVSVAHIANAAVTA